MPHLRAARFPSAVPIMWCVRSISTLTALGSSRKDPQQQPYGGFDHLPRRIGDGPLVFAMNAGMYERVICLL